MEEKNVGEEMVEGGLKRGKGDRGTSKLDLRLMRPAEEQCCAQCSAVRH